MDKMDPEEQFMMWILPHIMAEEEELQGQSEPPPPRQMSKSEQVSLKIFLIMMACTFFLCVFLFLFER